MSSLLLVWGFGLHDLAFSTGRLATREREWLWRFGARPCHRFDRAQACFALEPASRLFAFATFTRRKQKLRVSSLPIYTCILFWVCVKLGLGGHVSCCPSWIRAARWIPQNSCMEDMVPIERTLPTDYSVDARQHLAGRVVLKKIKAGKKSLELIESRGLFPFPHGVFTFCLTQAIAHRERGRRGLDGPGQEDRGGGEK